MSTDETYNGWTNRETWAVALHINNDQGWQESVHEALRAAEFTTLAETLPQSDPALAWTDEEEQRNNARQAGEIIKDNVEAMFDPTSDLWDGEAVNYASVVPSIMQDVGSLWRVNWDELGASFLDDLKDLDA